MKSLLIPAALLAAGLLGTSCQHDAAPVLTSPGAAITAVSYQPTASSLSPADLRARTIERLAYAEEVLRHKDTRRLPSHLRRRRYQTLKLLHAYRTTGEFPPAIDGEWPRLQDAQGRVDAVGYLMRETGGAGLVEQLDRQYPAARIETIDNPNLRHWVRMAGLTMEECALIQRAQ